MIDHHLTDHDSTRTQIALLTGAFEESDHGPCFKNSLSNIRNEHNVPAIEIAAALAKLAGKREMILF